MRFGRNDGERMTKKKSIIFVLILFIVNVVFVGIIVNLVVHDHPIIGTIEIVIVNGLGVLLSFRFFITLFENVGRDYRDIHKKYEMNTVLLELLKTLAEAEDTKKVYEYILESAVRIVPEATMGSVMMHRKGKVYFEAVKGFDKDHLNLIGMDVKETGLYKATLGLMNKAVIIDQIGRMNHDMVELQRKEFFEDVGIERIKTTIVAPIIVNKKVIGSINLDSETKDAFTKADMELMEVFAIEVGQFVRLNQAIEKNIEMSRYDELTRVYNRGYFNQQLRKMIQEKKEFILVSLDLNGLKSVNDQYGHDEGDNLIRDFVDKIKLFLGDFVCFGRYGGDEFMLLFPNYSETEVLVLFDDVNRFMHNTPVKNTKYDLYVSFSFGYSIFPKDTTDYDELQKLADQRMYSAKRKYKEEHIKI